MPLPVAAQVCGSVWLVFPCSGAAAPTLLAPGTGFVGDSFPPFGEWGLDRKQSSGANANLRCLPALTSCCAALFLNRPQTSTRPQAPRVGDPCSRGLLCILLFSFRGVTPVIPPSSFSVPLLKAQNESSEVWTESRGVESTGGVFHCLFGKIRSRERLIRSFLKL